MQDLIKRLDKKYISRIVRYEKIYFPKDAYDKDTIEEYFTKVNKIPLGVFVNNHFAGYILFSYNKLTSIIDSIVVIDKYRRNGLSILLYKRALKFLKNKGIKYVYNYCRVSNEISKKSILSSGFVLKKRIKDYYEDEDGYFFVRGLN